MRLKTRYFEGAEIYAYYMLVFRDKKQVKQQMKILLWRKS